jgi:hypothetical protein
VKSKKARKAVVKAGEKFTLSLSPVLKIAGPKGLDTSKLVELVQYRIENSYGPSMGDPLAFAAEELARLLDGEVASVELGEEPEGMIY